MREAAAAAEEEDLYLVRAEGDGLESAMDPGNVIIHANKKKPIDSELSWWSIPGDELNPLGAEAAAHTCSHPRRIMALAGLRVD